MLKTYAREAAVAATIVLLLILLAIKAPGFFTHENLMDIVLANMPVMLIALGMTLVVLTGNIDISVGSTFAICSVLMGAIAKTSLHSLDAIIAIVAGLACGALNGAFVAYVRVPSIVVTLATMVAFRDALRWITQGSWIGSLPPQFQWFGLSQPAYTALSYTIIIVAVASTIFGLRYLQAGRAIFATGSNRTAADLIGIRTNHVIFWTFALLGTLAGFAAMLNAVRFHQIPSNMGLGLEMQVIAAVAVGGVVFTGGSGTIVGTVLGVILLAIVGPGLTFLGLSAYWEKALQGGIVLAAIALNFSRKSSKAHAHLQPVPAS